MNTEVLMENLEKYRKEVAFLSQADFAESVLDIHRNTYLKLLWGQNQPSIKTLRKIQDALGKSWLTKNKE